MKHLFRRPEFSLPENDFSLTEDEHDGQRNEAAVSSRQTADVPEIPSDDLDFTLPENISSAEGIDALSQFMSQSLAKQQAQEENAGSSNFDEDVFHSLSQKIPMKRIQAKIHSNHFPKKMPIQKVLQQLLCLRAMTFRRLIHGKKS